MKEKNLYDPVWNARVKGDLAEVDFNRRERRFDPVRQKQIQQTLKEAEFFGDKRFDINK